MYTHNLRIVTIFLKVMKSQFNYSFWAKISSRVWSRLWSRQRVCSASRKPGLELWVTFKIPPLADFPHQSNRAKLGMSTWPSMLNLRVFYSMATFHPTLLGTICVPRGLCTKPSALRSQDEDSGREVTDGGMNQDWTRHCACEALAFGCQVLARKQNAMWPKQQTPVFLKPTKNLLWEIHSPSPPMPHPPDSLERRCL